jgi:hypothetical protein
VTIGIALVSSNPYPDLPICIPPRPGYPEFGSFIKIPSADQKKRWVIISFSCQVRAFRMIRKYFAEKKIDPRKDFDYSIAALRY